MSIFSKVKLFFQLFRSAVWGEEKEFTSGSINRAIFMLSIPMILEMVMESLFAVIDVFFVSQIGTDAVATVGLTETVLTIAYSLAIGISMASTAMIARRVGEKDLESASVVAVQSIYIALIISAIISVVGLFYASDILRVMGASNEVIKIGTGYIKWMLVGNFTILFLYLINGIFRGAGDASLAMRSLWIANIINIILDPILIFGWGPIPAMGVTGGAIGNFVGRGIGVLYQIYHLFKGNGLIKIHWENFAPKFDIIKRLLDVSIGGTGQFLIASASWVFLVRIMSMFGSEALAGYTIAIRVVIFTILPAWGMANAAATLVGQNLGAGQPQRAESSVWRTAFYSMIFLGLVSVLFLFTAEGVIKLFTDEIVTIKYGTQCLHYVCFGYVFYAYGMVISSSFNGAGDTRTPTILNFFGFWMFQIPVAYFMAVKMGLGPKGVFLAISLAESLLAVAGIIIFRMGKWKTVKI